MRILGSAASQESMLGSAFFILASAVLVPSLCVAQPTREVPVEGYITSVHLPESFDVNREKVLLSSSTGYGLFDDKVTTTDSPLREAINTGAYVRVVGPYDDRHRITHAQQVFFRDGLNKRLSGFGVIDHVVATSPDLVVQADGYRIRINGSTQTTFGAGLKALTDVAVNRWIHYDAKRDQDGTLLASSAGFYAPKPARIKAVKNLETYDYPVEMPDYDQHEDGRVKINSLGGWHKIPADLALQDRVDRIGHHLIPEYQTTLPDDDPSKIHFRFVVIDAKSLRGVTYDLTGLVLIPETVVERLSNDDQLAALLADGVAYQLQRQGSAIVKENRYLAPVLIAGDTLGFLVPGVGTAALLVTNGAAHREAEAFMEQRARVALSLMADAGFDPHQAPEAWRITEPKHLPADQSTLKYPQISGYQLGILNLQYR